MFEIGYETTTEILVNGTMNATSSVFNLAGNDASNTLIQVNSGGELIATGTTFSLNQLVLENGSINSATDLTNDTFNLPLYVPALDIPLLANNQSFQAIEMPATTLSTGQSLSLNLIGTTSTANLVYVFTGAFTIQAGATLSVSPNVKVEINANETITDSGALNTGSGTTFVFEIGYETTTEILVNGTMNATSSVFNLAGNDASNTLIQVNSGGELSATGTTFSLNQLVLENGSILSATDLTNDTFNLPLYVPALDIPLLANNQSFQAIEMPATTLSTGQSLSLNLIGTTSTANLVYVFTGAFTIQAGATLSVSPNVKVEINANETITDSGALNTGSGTTFVFEIGYETTTEILVNGTMNATSSVFNLAGNDASNTLIQVNSGGELSATGTTFSLNQLVLENGSILSATDLTNDTFNLPLYVPALDIPLLANNQSFQAIEMPATTLSTGQSLSLNLIGTTSTANLVYVFTGAFTIQAGATLSVSPNVKVEINANETITDSGALNTGSGTTFVFEIGYETTTEILVNGTMNATSSVFNLAGNDASNTLIQVNSGGELSATGTTFSLNQLVLENGSILSATDLTNDTFNLPLYVPALDIPLLANNQSFQAIEMPATTLSTGQSLSLNLIGTTSTANLVYVFTGAFTIQAGATLSVSPNVKVEINANETITDSGALNTGSGTTFVFEIGYETTTEILVNGTMNATSSVFNLAGNDASNTLIQVNSGGELSATGTTFSLNQLVLENGSILSATDLTNDTFNLPLYVPALDIPLLANNQSFQAIEMPATTLSTGQSLSLNLIGTTSTANLVYVFTGAFTIQAGRR